MKTIINVECMDQELVITNSPVIASGGVHENFIAFNFCEKWDGLGKTAVFYRNEKERFYSVLGPDDVCEIPHEVTDYEGNMYFGVYGEAGEVTKTSKILKYKINKGAMTTLLKPSEEPTPDIYQQLLSAYGQTNEAIAKETAEREASMIAEESARNSAINTAILAEENARKQADATEKTERQAEIAVERARIDQLTKMEEGSTTGDVELMDIRVDAGGQTHESAGEAVRSQYVALNTKIDDNVGQLSSEIANNPNNKLIKINDGYYWKIQADTNIVKQYAYNAMECFEPISINVGDKFYLSSVGVGTASTYLLADKDMKFLYESGIDAISGEITIDVENAKYLCVNHLKASGEVVLYKITQNTDFLIDSIKELDKTISNEIINNPNNKVINLNDGYYWKVQTDTNIMKQYEYNAMECFEPISINVGDKVYISAVGVGVGSTYYLADKDMKFLYDGGIEEVNGEISIDNENAKYLYVNNLKANGKPILYKATQNTESLIAFFQKHSGKSLACLGDSMTEGIGTTKIYHEWLNKLCGFKSIYNYGVGGTSIAPKTENYPTWEDGFLSFYERYNTMENTDVTLVLGGVNDWVTGRTLGTIEDTESNSFYGAFKLLLQGLITKNPSGKIYVFSSPQNDYVNRPANIESTSEFANNTNGLNRKGLKLQAYTNAMEEVCKMYGVPFYSLTDTLWWGLSGVLGDNNGTSGIYGSDGLHPNADGHKLIALQMSGFINNN